MVEFLDSGGIGIFVGMVEEGFGTVGAADFRVGSSFRDGEECIDVEVWREDVSHCEGSRAVGDDVKRSL